MRALMYRRSTAGGFALLAVLWVLVGISAIALATALTGREAVALAQNRIDLTKARWRAEGCFERAQAVIASVLSDRSTTVDELGRWTILDRLVPRARIITVASCDLTLRAAGTTLNVNSADRRSLDALFVALGLRPEQSDSLADALLDWRDGDDLPRPFGAERRWYVSRGRYPPRNGPLADVRELRRVRGFDVVAERGRVLGVEPGRISLAHAPPAVLAALPGMSAEVVRRIVVRRRRGLALRGLSALTVHLSPSARDTLKRWYADLARATTIEPDAWIVISRARVGSPPVTAVVEVRLVRAGERAAIVRRQTWVE